MPRLKPGEGYWPKQETILLHNTTYNKHGLRMPWKTCCTACELSALGDACLMLIFNMAQICHGVFSGRQKQKRRISGLLIRLCFVWLQEPDSGKDKAP